jgi:hypothetical protein
MFHFWPSAGTNTCTVKHASQRLTITQHGGRNVIDLWQSDLDSGTTPAATPSIRRSAIIHGYAQGSSQSRRSFEEALLEHCERIVASVRWQKLTVQLELRCDGMCPVTHEKTVLRAADELLSNAMEHGYYCRSRGHLFVGVVSRPGVGVQVSVNDDGWGFDSSPIVDGNGFHLLRLIGDLYVGAAKTAPSVANTTVTVFIPLNRCLT